MSAWHNMLARFRKPEPLQPPASQPEHAPQAAAPLIEELSPIAVETAVAVAEPPDDERLEALDGSDEAASWSPLDDRDATHRFGDTTRALQSTLPQLATLLGERVLSAAALRDIGRERRENQDHCFAQIFSFPTDHSELALGLFVVADGMGGHHDGGYASKLALSTVVQQILADFIGPLLAGERRAPQPVMQAALQAANAAVYEAGQAAGSDMGTTCTATLWYDGELITAHVGDSRALLISAGVTQLTTDHSAVGRLIAIGALTEDEARDHPLRNQLYRSIGQHAEVAVDVTTTAVHGEQHLLLCSDGLWGLVSEAEIVDIVSEAPTPQLAARHLIARANLLGGHDNISVVVATLPAVTGAQS